jgi:hypothetical protein
VTLGRSFAIRNGAVFRLNIGVPRSPDLDTKPAADLEELVTRLLAEVVALRQTVAARREEIARLNGLMIRRRSNPAA